MINRRSEGFFENIKRLHGLTVTVEKSCTGCGRCIDVCIARAIDMTDGKAIINEEYCKGCGNCVSVCGEGAIVMSLEENVDTVKNLLDTYSRRTNVGPLINLPEEKI